MDQTGHDILIAGGGLAGLIAAIAFARRGFAVAVAEPQPFLRPDPRSTAFLEPSVDLLRATGLWPALAPHATALRIMRLTAEDPQGGLEPFRDFASTDAGLEAFGFNLPNEALQRELRAAVLAEPRVTLLPPAGFLRATPRADHALVTLSDRTRVKARLIVAADGRGSAVVRALNLPVLERGFGQRALAFAISHANPHAGVSTEIHGPGGPFTLVPLTDPHRSAVIWMDRADRAADHAALDDAAFLARAASRARGAAGTLSDPGPRAAFPVLLRLTRRLTGPRSAVIGEAAHVVPPIGAQGLNMSLGDIASLARLAAEARDRGEDFGGPSVLGAWERRRLPEIALRLAGIGALNALAMLEGPALRRLRGSALSALHASPALRRGLMGLGLGHGLSPLALPVRGS